MNTLIQDKDSLLLGSREAIETLAEKQSSRILLISDSHGAAFTFSAILKQFGKDSDALIFCGDGMSDFTRCMEEASKDESFAECFPSVAAFVQGNNDTDMYPCINPEYGKKKDADYFSQLQVPLRSTFFASSHRILAVHGHRYSLYNGSRQIVQAAKNEKADVVIFGHTHFPLWEINYPYISVINPGSISRPRGMMPPGFAVLELEKGKAAEKVTFYKIGSDGMNPFIP